MLTRRSISGRKSAPRIGWSTSARRNWNWKRLEPNWRGINLEPQALVCHPSAIRRRGPVGAAEELWGNTDLEAPVSTKYCLTGHLEGIQDNHGQEGCLIFPPPLALAFPWKLQGGRQLLAAGPKRLWK